MVLLAERLPGVAPSVVFTDDQRLLFGMTPAPHGGVLWRDEHDAGIADPVRTELAATLLANFHAATFGCADVAQQFAASWPLVQGRIDPYHRTAALAHPDLAEVIDAEIERLLATRRVLVHGDFSPKNLIAYPDRMLMLDFEVAHWGDPAFDVAFLLALVVLDGMRHDDPAFAREARRFWSAYRDAAGPAAADEAAVVAELGCHRPRAHRRQVTTSRVRPRAATGPCLRPAAADHRARPVAGAAPVTTISSLTAREILDSRGRPTVEAELGSLGRHDGPRERPVGRLDRASRGGRAARRRRGVVRRAGGQRARGRDPRGDRLGAGRPGTRSGRRRRDPHRAGRNPGQVAARCQRDPGRLPGDGAGRSRRARPPALAGARRRGPGDAAHADGQHRLRWASCRSPDRLPGLPRHPGRRLDVRQGARDGGLRAPRDRRAAGRTRSDDAQGRRGRLRAAAGRPWQGARAAGRRGRASRASDRRRRGLRARRGGDALPRGGRLSPRVRGADAHGHRAGRLHRRARRRPSGRLGGRPVGRG